MKRFSFLLVFPVLLSFSCGFLNELNEGLILVLPDPPARFAAFGPHRFLLTCRDGGGNEKSWETKVGEKEIRLELRPRPSFPFLAEPLFGGRKGLLLPAGGLYPQGVDVEGKLRLSWEDGFAAEILLLAEARGFPLAVFNAERFFREARERGAGNPWRLDRKKILETLAALSFRADRMSPAKAYSVQVPGLEGDWFSWNPLLEPFSRGEDGEVVFGAFPPGFHRFFRSGGITERLDVQIEENGIRLWTKFSPW